MASSNDITGDKLISKLPTKEYEEGYDRIFGKETKQESNDSWEAVMGDHNIPILAREEAYDDTWRHEIGTYGTYGKDDGKEMV